MLGPPEVVASLRPGPFYWMAAQGMEHGFSAMSFADPKPAAGAKRWDAAETANYFNSIRRARRQPRIRFAVGPERSRIATISSSNCQRLPKDRCIPASPLDRAHRGPYACFAARTPEKTVALYDKLRKENVVVSLREGNIRVSPYLFNTERDIDRLISVITT